MMVKETVMMTTIIKHLETQWLHDVDLKTLVVMVGLIDPKDPWKQWFLTS